MSRFTAPPPISRPTIHKFTRNVEPNPILSPPEKDVEHGVPMRNSVRPEHPFVLDQESHNAESIGGRPRRNGSISYISSGIRESRERTVHSSLRTLIIVVPPLEFTQTHGQFGNAFGPANRLSNGILMPLFPTMNGQLAAIAREFNFPSTTGLCLYLHHSEGGIVITPRITEVSWSFIWASIFDTNTPSPSPPSPISGRVDFEIDYSCARWYSSWVSTLLRNAVDLPWRPPSLFYGFGDGRNSVGGEDNNNDLTEDFVSPLKATRHIPRKLSLVDRHDSRSVRSAVRPSSLKGLSPPSMDHLALSPIIQAEEPKSAKLSLDDRVFTWRASSFDHDLKDGPEAVQQITLQDSAPLEEDIDASSVLDLDDFDWSVSSAGPTYDEIVTSAFSNEYSVHVDRRVEGSVCLTPSTCTSFGPHSCYISSSTSEYLAPSVDLCQRNVFSPPMACSTTTSWGAPPTYLASSASPNYGKTPDFVQRCSDPEDEKIPSRGFVFPYHDLESSGLSSSNGQNTFNDWSKETASYTNFDLYPAVEQIITAVQSQTEKAKPDAFNLWNFVFPYYSSTTKSGDCLHLNIHLDAEHGVWPFVFPYYGSQADATQQSEDRDFVFPYYSPQAGVALLSKNREFSPVYHDSQTDAHRQRKNWEFIFPAYKPSKMGEKAKGNPDFDLYPALVQNPLIIQPQVARYMKGESQHPDVDLYPEVSKQVSIRLQVTYPTFDIYPAACPASDIYPEYSPSVSVKPETSVILREPAVYPHLNVHPQVEKHIGQKITMRGNTAIYPIFNLYPAVYPLFDLYPSALTVEPSKVIKGHPVVYPVFNLYPAVYPHFELYPARLTLDIIPGHPMVYPRFNLYPAVYPHFDLYPSHSVSEIRCIPGHPVVYPNIILYPAVYPHFALYPAKTPTMPEPVLVNSQTHYPIFNFYPAVYPFFDLYPSPACLTFSEERHNLAPHTLAMRKTHAELHRIVFEEFASASPRERRPPPLVSPQTVKSSPEIESSSENVPWNHARSGVVTIRPEVPSRPPTILKKSTNPSGRPVPSKRKSLLPYGDWPAPPGTVTLRTSPVRYSEESHVPFGRVLSSPSKTPRSLPSSRPSSVILPQAPEIRTGLNLSKSDPVSHYEGVRQPPQRRDSLLVSQKAKGLNIYENVEPFESTPNPYT